MIAYFADRNLNILATASTELPDGIIIKEDVKTEEIETGTKSFSGRIGYNDDTAAQTELALMPTNFVFRKADDSDECEIYTIITSENDDKAQDIDFYAEDGGLELLNEIALKWPDNSEVIVTAKTLDEYFAMYLNGTGFEIGVDESDDTTKLITWEQEHTVAGRLLDIANQFGYEIDYSFKISGFTVTKKYVNIRKRRGGDFGVQWRLNREVDKIVTKASAENLATALLAYGSVPEGSNLPVTLSGFTPVTPTPGYTIQKIYYPERQDFGYCLCSEAALEKYGTTDEQGNLRHVVKPYNFDTVDQMTLYTKTLEELQKVETIEYNWEVDVLDARDAKIGDTVYIVDEKGQLYLSARLLKLETSESDGKKTATLGDYVIQSSGISDTVRQLAAQFAGMVIPQITITRDQINKCVVISAITKSGTQTATVYDAISVDTIEEQYILAPTNADFPEEYSAESTYSIDDYCIYGNTIYKCIATISRPEEWTASHWQTYTGGTWSTDMPDWQPGMYYWRRTVTNMEDGTVVATNPVLDSSSQVMAEADYLLASMNNHFWVDEENLTGAYVTENDLDYSHGYALRMAASGIAQMYNGVPLNTFTGSGVTFYAFSAGATGNRVMLASYTTSGIVFNEDYDFTIGNTNGSYIKWDATNDKIIINADTIQMGGESVEGGKWYQGTGITGTSTTPTIFSGSGVTSAAVGDMYLNKSTSNTYRCTVGGAPNVAKWVYVNNIKGKDGEDGEDVTSQYITFSSSTGLFVHDATSSSVYSGNGTQILSTGITLRLLGNEVATFDSSGMDLVPGSVGLFTDPVLGRSCFGINANRNVGLYSNGNNMIISSGDYGTTRIAGQNLYFLPGSGGTVSFDVASNGAFVVSIGTTTVISHNGTRLRFPVAKDDAIGTGSDTTSLRINTSGGGIGVGGSARRLKEDISYSIDDEFDPQKLYGIKVAQFRYKKKYDPANKLQIGLIADDVREQFPVAAVLDRDRNVLDWNDRIMIPAMLKLIQEQHADIEKLKAQMNTGRSQ